MTEELARRLGVDAEGDPRPRLIAAVTLAAFTTAIGGWCSSRGQDDLHALVDDALDAVVHGFDRVA